MGKNEKIELVFEVPQSAWKDRFALADAVYEAGFTDAVVGLGVPGLMSVTLDVELAGDRVAIIGASSRILQNLPTGSRLRDSDIPRRLA